MLPSSHSSLPAIVALGNGFIVTATLWGAFAVEMIERRLRAAAAFLAAGAFLSCFGIIHSVRLDGSSYAIWRLGGAEREFAVQLTLAYAALAAAFILLSWRGTQSSRPRDAR
jgi:AGZA family xanthine/uracil permease-like MFS transporter